MISFSSAFFLKQTGVKTPAYCALLYILQLESILKNCHWRLLESSRALVFNNTLRRLTLLPVKNKNSRQNQMTLILICVEFQIFTLADRISRKQ